MYTKSVLALQEFDNQCSVLSQKSEEQALEYGVRAQEYLNRMTNESEAELNALENDYQQKLNKMRDQLEKQWLQKHGK